MEVELSKPPPLSAYTKLVGEDEINELKALATGFEDLKIQEINSTKLGGGVAEMLSSYVPFLRMLGVDVKWTVIEAEPEFFKITKTLHNFLQGKEGVSLSLAKTYWNTLLNNKDLIDEDSDIIVIHDPQPLGLIEFLPEYARKNKKVIWRCHVHLETLSRKRMEEIANLIEPTVVKYDAAIFSTFQFLPVWHVPCFVIPPFIDPLSEKNRELTSQEIDAVLSKYGIKLEKPLITQVSRFDMFKDQIGVIKAFKKVHEKIPCQLLLAGGGASDDPEYQEVLAKVRKESENIPDIHILDLPPNSHKEINAFQRASYIILQKSVREGFGLTVAEGLWKGKPVIGGRVGGIPIQIRDGWNGFLVSTVNETAKKILYLLKHPQKASEMGKRGIETVREHFLLTRGVSDHLTALYQTMRGHIVSRKTIISYHPWC